MRLIDADTLKFDIMCVYGCNPQYINWLNHAPTVDAVPVIRCKDCKWYYRGGATCMFWDGANSMCGDDYCRRAERKEE